VVSTEILEPFLPLTVWVRRWIFQISRHFEQPKIQIFELKSPKIAKNDKQIDFFFTFSQILAIWP